jgi:type III secretion protein R
MLSEPINLAVVVALMTLAPLMVVVCTSFMKITVVMSLLRNAMGVQQIPPNMALYGLALILSAYVMAPIGNQVYTAVKTLPTTSQNVGAMVDTVAHGIEPLRGFLARNAKPEQKAFFFHTASHLWGPELSADLTQNDFLILMPAFMVSEITRAFQVGFLIYLPFVVIDLIVSNILLAMGMMMVSPVTISLPLKLFLFVMVDGWTRLIQGLVLSYV